MDQLAFSTCCRNLENTCTPFKLPSVRVLDRCLCLILTLFAVQRDERHSVSISTFLVSDTWLIGAEQQELFFPLLLRHLCASPVGLKMKRQELELWWKAGILTQGDVTSSVWARSSTALTLTLIQRTSGLGPCTLSDFSDMTFSHGSVIYSVNLGFPGHWKWELRALGRGAFCHDHISDSHYLGLIVPLELPWKNRTPELWDIEPYVSLFS